MHELNDRRREHIVKHPQLQRKRTCLATFSADDEVDRRLANDVEKEPSSKTSFTLWEGGKDKVVPINEVRRSTLFDSQHSYDKTAGNKVSLH